MPPALLPMTHKMLGHASYLLAGVGGLVAVDLREQITISSIIVACVILAIAFLFTARSKIATVWREEADGQKAKAERLQTELDAARADRAEFDKAQQDLRHGLTTEIATLTANMKVLEAKTDLTKALETIRQINEAGVAAIVGELSGAIGSAIRMALDDRDNRLYGLLEEIRDTLSERAVK
jgi:flagellar motility protein MotE (MotC chaperone)